MGVRHRELVVEGIQFHPESIASDTARRACGTSSATGEPFPLSTILAGLQKPPDDDPPGGRVLRRDDRRPPHRRPDAGVLASTTSAAVTAPVLAGFAAVLRCKKRPFASDRRGLKSCGTGGDARDVLQFLSAAVVAAACGALVGEARQPRGELPRGECRLLPRARCRGISPARRRTMLREEGFCFLSRLVITGGCDAAPRAQRAGHQSVISPWSPSQPWGMPLTSSSARSTSSSAFPSPRPPTCSACAGSWQCTARTAWTRSPSAAPTAIVEVDETGRRSDYALTRKSSEYAVHRGGPARGTAVQNAQLRP